MGLEDQAKITVTETELGDESRAAMVDALRHMADLLESGRYVEGGLAFYGGDRPRLRGDITCESDNP